MFREYFVMLVLFWEILRYHLDWLCCHQNVFSAPTFNLTIDSTTNLKIKNMLFYFPHEVPLENTFVPSTPMVWLASFPFLAYHNSDFFLFYRHIYRADQTIENPTYFPNSLTMKFHQYLPEPLPSSTGAETSLLTIGSDLAAPPMSSLVRSPPPIRPAATRPLCHQQNLFVLLRKE